MKKGLLFLLVWFFPLRMATALERAPEGLFISREGVHLREALRLSSEELKELTLWFPALLKEKDLRVVRKPEDCKVVLESLGAGPPAGPVAESLVALERKIGEVERELATLSFEKKRLEDLPRLRQEGLQDFLTTISRRYREILEREKALEERLVELHRQEGRLRQALSLKKVSYFRLRASCKGLRPLEILVEYPVEGVSFERERELRILPEKGRLILQDLLRLKESLGVPLKGIEVVWETFPREIEILEPPPFKPWWVGEAPLRATIALEKKARALPALPEPAAFGKIYRLSGISLEPGVPEVFSLETRKLSGEFRVEIPAYFRPRAYLAVSFKPDTYFPAARTRIFLGETLLSRRSLPDLRPGKDYTFYLGPDPWVRVEKEVLRDYEETGGVVHRSRRRTRLWEIRVDYRHRESLPVILYEKVPVSRREEVRVKVKAEPPWEELSPEGRARWSFRLREGEKKVIRIEAVVETPAP